jgi:glycosyltransferase involved in cell wall biosynthesis
MSRHLKNGDMRGGTASTPTVDGNRVYTMSYTGELYCLEAKTDEVKWAKDIQREFNGKPAGWGYAGSPLVVDDMLIVETGAKEGSLIALNKESGSLIWKSGNYSAGLSSEVEFHPNLDRQRKIEFLKKLSLFSVPAKYGEAFGLYLLEAMAAGVPVVQPRHAAFPELIESTGGGRLYEPNDPESLADSWEDILANPEEARSIGLRGRQSVIEKYSIHDMAKTIELTCRKLVQLTES